MELIDKRKNIKKRFRQLDCGQTYLLDGIVYLKKYYISSMDDCNSFILTGEKSGLECECLDETIVEEVDAEIIIK